MVLRFKRPCSAVVKNLYPPWFFCSRITGAGIVAGAPLLTFLLRTVPHVMSNLITCYWEFTGACLVWKKVLVEEESPAEPEVTTEFFFLLLIERLCKSLCGSENLVCLYVAQKLLCFNCQRLPWIII